MFSDGVHGSQDKALKAAIKYKEEYENNHPPSYPATRMRLRPMKNNTSGVVGVSETFSRSRNGNILPCFNVSWRPRRNFSRSKSFFFSKYGAREAAFEAATKFRKEREAEIIAGIES